MKTHQATSSFSTHLIKPNLVRTYPVIDYGKGVYLYDQQRRRYLDGCSGAIAVNIGHGVPEIKEAMRKQAELVSFVYRTQFTSDAAEELASRLARLAPGDLEWLFFVNSGSEATEAALRLAIQYWRERNRPEKTHIISRHVSYHGMTLGALSMSGHMARRQLYEPLLQKFPAVVPSHCYRCPLGLQYPSCELACVTEWEKALKHLGSDSVAAVIVEPVVGAAAGALPAPPHYLQKLREICDRYEVLLIADEIMTGLGRTGAWFGCNHDEIVPDLIAVGKGMGAGYTPMSAVIARSFIVETLYAGSGTGGFGHTYSANPFSARICLTVLDYLEQHNLVRAAQERGEELRLGLENLASRHPLIGDVRGQGLLLGLELISDRIIKQPFPAHIGIPSLLVDFAFKRGLLIYPAGVPGYIDAVLVAPPFTITSIEIQELLLMLEETMNDLEQYLVQKKIWNEDTCISINEQ